MAHQFDNKTIGKIRNLNRSLIIACGNLLDSNPEEFIACFISRHSVINFVKAIYLKNGIDPAYCNSATFGNPIEYHNYRLEAKSSIFSRSKVPTLFIKHIKLQLGTELIILYNEDISLCHYAYRLAATDKFYSVWGENEGFPANRTAIQPSNAGPNYDSYHTFVSRYFDLPKPQSISLIQIE